MRFGEGGEAQRGDRTQREGALLHHGCHRHGLAVELAVTVLAGCGIVQAARRSCFPTGGSSATEAAVKETSMTLRLACTEAGPSQLHRGPPRAPATSHGAPTSAQGGAPSSLPGASRSTSVGLRAPSGRLISPEFLPQHEAKLPPLETQCRQSHRSAHATGATSPASGPPLAAGRSPLQLHHPMRSRPQSRQPCQELYTMGRH